MILRPYQKISYAAVLVEWASGILRTLLVLPTGTGKTIVFAQLASFLTIDDFSNRILILAHRDELIRQAADKLQKITGISCSIEKAEENCRNQNERIVIGSVQSLQNGRLAKFPKDFFSHIIIDEAHHALSKSYLSIMDHFDQAKVLGVTATPDRGDKQDLGKLFSSVAFEYPMLQAVKDEWLCRIKSQTLPISIDISKVQLKRGDFDKDQLATALDPYLPEIAREVWRVASQRKILCFLPLCITAQKMRDELAKVGFRSYYVSGEDRSELSTWDNETGGSACCNAMLLTEGYDNPQIDAIVFLRPTKIRSMYAQAVGRGTRICPGKDFLYLPDFLWNTDKHTLCRPANLMAPSQEIADLMMEKQDKKPDELTEIGEGEVVEAKNEVLKQREKSLAEQLKVMRKKKAKLVDPLQWASSVSDADLLDYVPTMPNEMGPASKKQEKALEKAGINPDAVTCVGAANMILDKLTVRRQADLATPRQIRVLERYKVNHAGSLPFEKAQNAINRLAANGWRKPFNGWTDEQGNLV